MRRNGEICRWIVLAGVLAASCDVTCGAEAKPPLEAKAVPINGMEMYYEIHGHGEPLVLLHGFFGSGQFWEPLLPAFAEKYQVIVPDLRNHGRSTNPIGTFTHRQAAKDVFALLDQLEIDRFRAMGFSTGGMTLLHMATSQPERVRDIVLIGASPYLPAAGRNYRQLNLQIFMETPGLAVWAPLHPRGEEQIRELLELWYSFENSYDDMNFTPPYLSTIKANTLIIHGDRDRHFPLSIAATMYESIPSSYLWIIPNGGHVPDFDNPTWSTEPVLDFLRGEWDSNNDAR